MRNAYRVTNGGDLIPHALHGIAEETTIDDEATCDGIALRLISNQSYIHNFLGSFLLFVSVFVINSYERAAEGQYLAEGDKERMVYLA